MSTTQTTLALDIASGVFVHRLALQKALADKAAELDIGTIATDDDLSAAASKVKEAKAFIKKVEEARKTYTSQLDGLKKQLMAQEAELVAPLKNVVLMYNHLSAEYAEHKRQQRLEAERAAAKAAEEAQRKYEQAQAAAALGVDATPAAEEAAKAAERAASALTPQQLDALKPVAGVSMRTRWDFRVTDPDKVNRRFLIVDASLVRAELQRIKKSGVALSTVHLDGIEVFETTSAVAR